MKIIWFLPTSNKNFNNISASVWIRALQIIPYLEKINVKSYINEETVQADLAIFVRRQDAMDYELATRLKKRNIKLILDLCVNYFVESNAPGMLKPVTKKHINNCVRMTNLCDAVFCASINIKDSAAKFNKKSYYLPDSVDEKHFKSKKNENDFLRKRIRAVWAGTTEKSKELLEYMGILQELNIPLRIISETRPRDFGYPFFFSSNKAYYSKWKYETFPQTMLKGDFVFAPRNISESYNRGHSFFKIGIFLSVGIPVIASPIPSYKELIFKNNCGKLCKTKNDFRKTLKDISTDRQRLVTWSKSAQLIMKKYTTFEISKKYVEIFTKILKV